MLSQVEVRRLGGAQEGGNGDGTISSAPPTHFSMSGMDDSDTIRGIAKELWGSRDLLLQLSLRDIRIRYKQAVMGFGWAIFMPMMLVMSGAIVRLAMARSSGVPLDKAEIGVVALKAIPWGFVTGAIGFAVNSLVSNINLITKIYFPREVLPLSAVAAQAFDSTIASLALAVALPFLGAKLTWALLWVPVLAAYVMVLTTGICLLVSCANLFFRDVKYLVQILLTFGVFVTPVFFEPAMLGRRGAVVMGFNPLTPALEGLRLAVFNGESLLRVVHSSNDVSGSILVWHPLWLAGAAAFSLVLLLFTLITFRRLQFTFAERI